MRPLKKPTFAQFLRHAQILILKIRECIPVVKIFAFLELKQNLAFFKGLNISLIEPKIVETEKVLNVFN
jgi:hypothetical protein